MKEMQKNRTRSDNVKISIAKFHTVIDGASSEKLSEEDMDLYRFLVGGMQAK